MYEMTEEDGWEDILKKPWRPSSVKRPALYLIQPKKIPTSNMGLRVFTPDETPQKGGKINEM